jgi:8-oxo-dGTP diphosphatase
MDDRAPVNLRCSAVVFRGDSVLLCRREAGDWVIPGGTPRPGEGSAACVIREVREETGLSVTPQRVAFVLEANNLDQHQHLIEIVFHAVPVDLGADPYATEPGLGPRYVPLADLAGVPLMPPIAGHIRSLSTRQVYGMGVYLGNVWRPTPAVAALNERGAPA